MSADFGPIRIRWEAPDGGVRTREFPMHSLTTGWIVGYNEQDEAQMKIPRNRVFDVEVLDG